MSLADELAAKHGDVSTKPGPRKTNGHNGTSWFEQVNAVDVVSVLDWLGIEHDGKRVRCPGCGEGMDGTDVAIVNNGVKCLHARCSNEGKAGFRTNVDLTMAVQKCGATEAAAALADRFGIAHPERKQPSERSSNDNPDSWTVDFQEPDPEYWGGGPKEDYEQQAKTPRILTADDIFGIPDHIDTLVPGLGIKPGPPTLVVARSGIGKSVILQSAAISAALGRPWWGMFPVQRPLKVIWIDLEQGRQTTLLRFKRLALAQDLTPDDLRGKLGVWVSPNGGKDVNLVQLFTGYDLAFIDCYRVLARNIDENDSRARVPLDECAQASELTGCAPVVIHHGRKATENARGGARDVTRGSSAIQDAADAVFFFDRDGDEPEGPINCQCTKVPRATGKAPRPWTLEIQDIDLQVNADSVIRDGGLTVTGRREPQVDAFDSARQIRKAKTNRVQGELVALFQAEHTLGGLKAIAARLGRDQTAVSEALALLIEAKRVTVSGATRDRKHHWSGQDE